MLQMSALQIPHSSNPTFISLFDKTKFLTGDWLLIQFNNEVLLHQMAAQCCDYNKRNKGSFSNKEPLLISSNKLVTFLVHTLSNQRARQAILTPDCIIIIAIVTPK